MTIPTDLVLVPRKAVDFILAVPKNLRETEAAHYRYSNKPFNMRDFGFNPDFVRRMIEVEQLILSAPSPWRDIESAPKDGTVILVYGQPSQIDGLRLGCGMYTAYWDSIDGSFCLSAATWLGPFIQPAHWMPLPTPPKDGEK